MRKADDGANEHEKDSELGVHFTPLHYISRPHSLFDTTFLLAIIDEDQKHIAEDASLPVRFIPSSANTARQPLKRPHARRVMSRPRHFFHGTMRQRLAYTGSMTH